MKNYYAILEVPVGSGLEDIRRAYRRLVSENLDSETAFAELQEAYEVLSSPERRAEYDAATWGQTFDAGGADATLLGGASVPGLAVPAGAEARCPMGAANACPALLGRTSPGDTFCPDCGFRLAGLTAGGFEEAPADLSREIRLEDAAGVAHRLRPGANLVGREGTDILLPDKTVSRRHARLDVGADGAVTVEDLGSTNGTQVGGELLVPHVPRRAFAGDRVRFGSVPLSLHLPDPALGGPISGSPAAPAPAAPEPAATLPALPGDAAPAFAAPAEGARGQMVELREDSPRTYPLRPGRTSFGRRADNSVVLSGDPYVSGSHAQIAAETDVFTLTDVGSTNGTLLNGQRLEINAPVILTPGDVVLIGGTALRFERTDLAEGGAESGEDAEEGEDADETEAPSAEAAPEAGHAAEPPARTAAEYDVPEDPPAVPDARDPAPDAPA